MSKPFQPGISASEPTLRPTPQGPTRSVEAFALRIEGLRFEDACHQGSSPGPSLRTRHPLLRGAQLLVPALVMSFLCGCGIMRSTTALRDATSQYEEARRAGAAKKARYEYVLGLEYLRKAQEEAGYSDYSTAEKLAKQANVFLKKAANTAEGKDSPSGEEEDDAPVRRPSPDDADLPQE